MRADLCPAFLSLVHGPCRLRLRYFLRILVAFIGAGLLVKYTYNINLLKPSTPASESSDNKLLSILNKTGFKLPIRSGVLEAEAASNNQNVLLPILQGVHLDEAKNAQLPSHNAIEGSLQNQKTTISDVERKWSHEVEIVSGSIKKLNQNTEAFVTASTKGPHATTSSSEVLKTAVHESSFVEKVSQPVPLNSCGVKPEGLKQVVYDSAELESTFKRLTPSGSIWSKIKPAMTAEEREIVRLLLLDFIKICDTYSIRNYFIFSGTLLGSYRHHGLQPWDDDIDILMQFSDQWRILDVFERTVAQSQELVVKFINSRLKLFYRTRSIRIDVMEHRWPFLDISFYRENETHIWELYEIEKLRYHEVPKALLFPLHLRPFESVMINSPRDPFAILRLLFYDDQCVSLTWLHKTELAPPTATISFQCERVAPIYPFVHRRVAGSCIEESLRLNDTFLYAVLIEEPTYAFSMPFRLIQQQQSVLPSQR